MNCGMHRGVELVEHEIKIVNRCLTKVPCRSAKST